MKTAKLSRLALAFIVICGVNTALVAQTPFSGQPVSISKSASQSAMQTESTKEKPSLWDRFVKKVKSTYQSLTSTINKAVTKDTPPAFVSSNALIPGHESREFVCQGVAWLPNRVINPASLQSKASDYQNILLSYYCEPDYTDHPSQLVVVNRYTGKPLRRFALYQSNNSPYTGHAGGVAVAGKYVWVASGYKIYGFRLQEILDFINDKTAKAPASLTGIPKSLQIPTLDLTAAETFEVDSKASFVSFDGTHIWVGDFVKSSNKDFAPIAHHTTNPFSRKTWIAGYKVDADGLPTATRKYTFTEGDKSRTAFKPDSLIFCRESVQGMAVCGKYVALSISYGALNSKLALYNSPLSKPATKLSFKPAGQSKTFTADAWELADGVNWLKTVDIAAGSEDLEYDGNGIYVTFEGGSKNYRQKWVSINPLVTISDNYYYIRPANILKK
ncbi:MAG TPA: hypothetical protein PLM07_09615 [Candidatus Rifleibacterium sp.]|nr:hypothetical protein [Candidatus Rifleibacterium sp.]HPT46146.1 hypothetical protein [Candidatus Rifleibacterium sp.]